MKARGDTQVTWPHQGELPVLSKVLLETEAAVDHGLLEKAAPLLLETKKWFS